MAQLERFLEVQIAEDDSALVDHAACKAGCGPEVLTSRTTPMQDRSGLELALMLLAG
ncbi:hypothetical protein [Nocardia sp. NPDC004860]|uniref:hypothetical protein n=1 Tax=Nocardia sp. NPDC004860 TaxID=3154557 RepID=UPI0033B721F1